VKDILYQTTIVINSNNSLFYWFLMSRKEYINENEKYKVILLDYKELVKENSDYTESIGEAYGFDGLGILAVKNIPNLSKLRQDLLPLGHKFANLPEEAKSKTEHKKKLL